mmetsp:Transcript_2520/g.5880  ORF Transcript_2520/g.5880 Transcript_2520/m.5880 type:complete len:123 (+) Transcript_2520:1882-2250(+)
MDVCIRTFLLSTQRKIFGGDRSTLPVHPWIVYKEKKNHQEVILIKFIVCVYKPQENPHKNQSRIIRFLFPRQASFVSFMSSEDFCFYHSVKNSCNVACMFLFPIQARHTHNPKRRHGDDILL